jgi:hypothetical protein
MVSLTRSDGSQARLLREQTRQLEAELAVAQAAAASQLKVISLKQRSKMEEQARELARLMAEVLRIYSTCDQ